MFVESDVYQAVAALGKRHCQETRHLVEDFALRNDARNEPPLLAASSCPAQKAMAIIPRYAAVLRSLPAD